MEKTKLKQVGNYFVEDIPLPAVRSFQMWNSDTKQFERWYDGECEHCTEPVDRYTGECPKYKCWIS